MKLDLFDIDGGEVFTAFVVFAVAALGSLAVLVVAGAVWCVMALFG